MSSEKQTGSGGSFGSFKFNTVGREEAATEVLTQQIDPATKMRNLIFGIVALVVLAGLIYAAFQESGKAIFAQPTNNRKFEPPSNSGGL